MSYGSFGKKSKAMILYLIQSVSGVRKLMFCVSLVEKDVGVVKILDVLVLER